MDIALRREKKHMISAKMIETYCRGNKHTSKDDPVCDKCQQVMDYSQFRTSKCPYIKKTLFCVNCPTPCYKPDMKEEMRKVMKYAGPRFLFKHPIYFIHHVYTDYTGRSRDK